MLLSKKELASLPLEEKVSRIVEFYRTSYPEEYSAVCKLNSEKRDTPFNQTGRMKGVDYINRPILSIPETLEGIFVLYLKPEELDWLMSKHDETHKGIRWFVRTYKEFRPVDAV